MSVETQDPRQPTDTSPGPARGSRRRGLVRLAGLLLCALVLLAALILLPRLVPSLPNPFGVDRVDRTGPAVLHALQDLSEYRGATGHFQVILDVEDDARFLPSALQGQRTLFVAGGTVDAVVDFNAIGDDAVEVSSDRTRAVIRLPAARLAEPRVDPEHSYVYERRRGLIDRIGSMFSDTPTSDRELYLLAEQRLAEAAEETDLTDTAERNTTAMLKALLDSLGFTDLEVRYAEG